MCLAGSAFVNSKLRCAFFFSLPQGSSPHRKTGSLKMRGSNKTGLLMRHSFHEMPERRFHRWGNCCIQAYWQPNPPDWVVFVCLFVCLCVGLAYTHRSGSWAKLLSPQRTSTPNGRTCLGVSKWGNACNIRGKRLQIVEQSGMWDGGSHLMIRESLCLWLIGKCSDEGCTWHEGLAAGDEAIKALALQHTESASA